MSGFIYVFYYSIATKEDCKLITEDGEERRIYVGESNLTKSGKPCLAWTNVSHEYSDYAGIGDHNYCRNPGRSHSREWCYYTLTKFEDCGVRTCGMMAFKSC